MKPQLNLDEVLNLFKSLNITEQSTLLSKDRKTSGLENVFGILPDKNIQYKFTGLDNSKTFLQALTFLKLCNEIVIQNSIIDVTERNFKVIDFGAGWGRITQLLSLYFNPLNILACDVLIESIEMLKTYNIKCESMKLNSWPPSNIEKNSIDFIYSYSVFSHLSEECTLEWIKEFYKILKPNGFAFLTTRDSSFFDLLEILHNMENPPIYALGAKETFRDINKARNEYEMGKFCFDDKGSGGEFLKGFYGEALIPERYVKNVFGKIFREVGFEHSKPQYFLDQATIWLKK
jgi:2-polyprenyl-3-methyl-5-hydroxy-6-metoxy-1,4-benzoquinol methylase